MPGKPLTANCGIDDPPLLDLRVGLPPMAGPDCDRKSRECLSPLTEDFAVAENSSEFFNPGSAVPLSPWSPLSTAIDAAAVEKAASAWSARFGDGADRILPKGGSPVGLGPAVASGAAADALDTDVATAFGGGRSDINGGTYKTGVTCTLNGLRTIPLLHAVPPKGSLNSLSSPVSSVRTSLADQSGTRQATARRA